MSSTTWPGRWVAAMARGHVWGLLIGEKASSIPDTARRPWTGRLPLSALSTPERINPWRLVNLPQPFSGATLAGWAGTPSGRCGALFADAGLLRQARWDDSSE